MTRRRRPYGRHQLRYTPNRGQFLSENQLFADRRAVLEVVSRAQTLHNENSGCEQSAKRRRNLALTSGTDHGAGVAVPAKVPRYDANIEGRAGARSLARPHFLLRSNCGGATRWPKPGRPVSFSSYEIRCKLWPVPSAAHPTTRPPPAVPKLDYVSHLNADAFYQGELLCR
jgi:hypothetical protein